MKNAEFNKSLKTEDLGTKTSIPEISVLELACVNGLQDSIEEFQLRPAATRLKGGCHTFPQFCYTPNFLQLLGQFHQTKFYPFISEKLTLSTIVHITLT